MRQGTCFGFAFSAKKWILRSVSPRCSALHSDWMHRSRKVQLQLVGDLIPHPQKSSMIGNNHPTFQVTPLEVSQSR